MVVVRQGEIFSIPGGKRSAFRQRNIGSTFIRFLLGTFVTGRKADRVSIPTHAGGGGTVHRTMRERLAAGLPPHLRPLWSHINSRVMMAVRRSPK